MKTSKSLKIGDLSFKFAQSSNPGMGFIVSKKYGDSVRRNLFKRRCRSLFKTKIVDNKIFYSVVVRPNKQSLSHQSINKSFQLLYDQIHNKTIINLSH